MTTPTETTPAVPEDADVLCSWMMVAGCDVSIHETASDVWVEVVAPDMIHGDRTTFPTMGAALRWLAEMADTHN